MKRERKGVNEDSLLMVHFKDATFDNSHVPGPDRMMPEKKNRREI